MDVEYGEFAKLSDEFALVGQTSSEAGVLAGNSAGR
jgi:hypothetical protein